MQGTAVDIYFIITSYSTDNTWKLRHNIHAVIYIIISIAVKSSSALIVLNIRRCLTFQIVFGQLPDDANSEEHQRTSRQRVYERQNVVCPSECMYWLGCQNTTDHYLHIAFLWNRLDISEIITSSHLFLCSFDSFDHLMYQINSRCILHNTAKLYLFRCIHVCDFVIICLYSGPFSGHSRDVCSVLMYVHIRLS